MADARPRVLVTRKLPAAVEARLCATYEVHLNATGNLDAFFSGSALPCRVV